MEDRFSRFVPTELNDFTELMVKQWAQKTYDSIEALDDFDPDFDFFFPLILYADKTGTDVLQRYPLEPWMFTTALFWRSIRENSDSWRHLGFLPSLDEDVNDNSSNDEPGSKSSSNTAQESLQLYHDFLTIILQGVKDCHENKPVEMLNLGGIHQKRRLHVHVAVVMGDQKSQDCVCGSKVLPRVFKYS